MPFKEQELAIAQAVAKLAVWEWDLELNKLHWLPGSPSIYGRPPEELSSAQDLLDCVLPEDRSRVQAAVQEAVASGADFRVEFRVHWPDGETHCLASQGRPAVNSDGRKMVLGVTRDVSERQKTLEELRLQARLLDLAYEPILLRDAEDHILYWNDGASRLYGYSGSEARGSKSHELLRTRFPAPLRTINRELDRRGMWEGELVHTAKTGATVHVSSRWQKVRSREGKPSILETNFDLSHRKAYEVARIWEEKAKLIAVLAHEVNNPLAALSGATYLLKHNCKTEDNQRYVEVLESSIQRIADFVRQSRNLHNTPLDEWQDSRRRMES